LWLVKNFDWNEIMQKIIAVTAGEVAGIGYDILVKAAQEERQSPWLVFADADVLRERAQLLDLPLEILCMQDAKQVTQEKQRLTIFNVPCAEKVIPGVLNAKNALAVVDSLAYAAQFCLNNTASALVTLPVHKGIINEAGIPFTGHTEFFAQQAGIEKVVMMLASPTCRVALVTTHLPLKNVAENITGKNIASTVKILVQHLQRFHQLFHPKILVTGLNPHAGENGYLGREELEIITPCLESLRGEIQAELIGPLAADTLFQAKYLDHADAIVAMYHDQGLAPLKALAFGNIVNITCGLPFLRTSVDHGVALDLAGTGQANISSFELAIKMAEAPAPPL
jgi:4-hydroxythreonine-4-phosphate dehydrogenase